MDAIMRTGARLCAALLACWLPLAAAQERPPKAAPAEEVQREDVQREVDEALEAIRGYSLERRKEALARAGDSMQEADRRIERLDMEMNERWNRMDAATRQRSRVAMAELRQRRNDVAEWTGAMRHGSGERWNEVKAGFAASYGRLSAALRKVRAQFDRDEPSEPQEDEASRDNADDGPERER